MTLPAILFGFVVSLFAGSVFHLLTGGGGARLVMYLLAAAIGFWIGHALGAQFNLNFLSVGPLRFGTGMLLCLIFLGISYWMSLAHVAGKPAKR